ncbi:recombinase family protein [Intestinimonas sp.]|uniref:recombinase family protein n=1 Tax=Intestinimonas sp. TaxID=1965293 RepID=UPI00260F74D5|nr:recombinase family protein [Intestinimonas sp.]
MSLRAALYLRLSRDDGAGESVSIGGQRALLRAYAADRGWTVVGEYVDDTAILGLKSELQ